MSIMDIVQLANSIFVLWISFLTDHFHLTPFFPFKDADEYKS